MKGNPEERAVRLGEYIVATGATCARRPSGSAFPSQRCTRT